MEGSSETGWQRSSDNNNSSRGGLNSSSGTNIRYSGDASQHSLFISGAGKPRRRTSAHHFKSQIGDLPSTEFHDVSLRQWLDNTERTVDSLECLHIFTQIVQIVNLAHSQGIVVHNVRPSCFIMSSYNRVSFLESASCSDSGSDEDGGEGNTAAALASNFTFQTADQLEPGNNKPSFPMKQILLMETTWYTSPEEVSGSPSTCASDIYRLGVLLFELFGTFSSAGEKGTTMSSLRHRVLPPQILLKWPKEASFCLWLLHPDPTGRPSMSELMQSEFLNEPKNNLEERDAAIELRENIEEQELLLEFLLLIQQRKQEAANSLNETVSFLSSDIEEVARLQTALMRKGGPDLELGGDSVSGPSTNLVDDDDSHNLGSRKRFRQALYTHYGEESDERIDEDQKSETPAESQPTTLSKTSRLMKNFRKLEAAYFLTRIRAFKPAGIPLPRQHRSVSSDGRGSTAVTEKSSVSNVSPREQYDEDGKSGWIHSFLEGLSKYLSFSKLKVKADLKQGDLLNSSNLVCSLGFDRDGEFFATAGVNKKIKVFEYNSILDGDRDIHYPVVEMGSRSKLSSICWNGYIKSQIASSNFEGVVQVWDVTRSQIFMEMREHERRIWSVDFSVVDPTMLASGSDDGSVKLWSINQGVSVGTIKTKANVCCVQFPLDSGRSLAFGSADHKIYYYDLRNAKMPLCTLIGHNKTVSYVKFIDSTTLVSASTDNTLKLWDLSTCTSRVLDNPVQTFTGHMNVKNFVGLSVSDGYIVTGSETNEVFVYHKAFPMPALSMKFGNTDPLSGDEVDDPAQFISSVCWRGQSPTLLAANSLGNLKILEMI